MRLHYSPERLPVLKLCYPEGVQPPSFAQPERRSFVLPATIAFAILVLAVIVLHRATASSISATLLHSETLPNTTVYKSDTIVLGPPQTTYTLFVVTQLRVENHRNLPLSLDEFTLTLTDADGAQLTAKALRPQELDNAELSFPALKPLVRKPLLAVDTVVSPNRSAEGVSVFSLAVPQSVWDGRRSATITITPYRLDAINLNVPIK